MMDKKNGRGALHLLPVQTQTHILSYSSKCETREKKNRPPLLQPVLTLDEFEDSFIVVVEPLAPEAFGHRAGTANDARAVGVSSQFHGKLAEKKKK
jgi:hypothetical protein